VFVNRSLSSQNMWARASKWLEKNLHTSLRSGSIFFATLAHTASTHHASAPAHSLRFVWCSAWRGCLFCCTSFAQSSPVATLAPLNPNKVFADAHTLFERGQPPLIVLLACGSLGLIGVSHFL